MKILHTEASCGWGGQEIRILEESRGMIDRGHSVAVACPPHARIAEEAPRYGVPVVPLLIGSKRLAGFFSLRRHLDASGYDVVNTHSSTDSWLTALACATLPRPPAIVRTRHVSVPVANNLANRWLYRQACAVVTTGEILRRHLLDTLGLAPSSVMSVPTGINIERFSPTPDKTAAKIALGLDPACRHIGIVATLRSWKGHEFLLDAYAQVAQENLRLLIVGDGPQLEAIKEKISILGIGTQVTLAGQQVNPEPWLQAMDVFCLPSYANEGVPQALLQAMLVGVPIVTTPVGAILEAVTDNVSALIAPPKDGLGLARQIVRLLDDADLAARLVAVARSRALRHFSRDVMLNRMETIFSAASGSSPC